MPGSSLAQAFGRLIRTAEDKGQFVLLSAATPSRLLTAFPPGTPVHRVTLDEAVKRIKSGLSPVTKIVQGLAQETQQDILDEDIPF